MEEVSLPGWGNDSLEDQGDSKAPEVDESSYQCESSDYLKDESTDLQNFDHMFIN